MAKNTSKSLRNQIMYSVYVRNYSTQGDFNAVKNDVKRIRGLGADYVWLLPIHPIGKIERKGSLGSPYAISDYRGINPEFGNLDDFIALVDAIHEHGMKCIIDVVYNHTSPDSWLVQNHPEWFFRKDDGNFGNKVGAWLDVIDLDFTQLGLWDYLVETLKQWAKIVDGFRCDVAPLIPIDFWLRARREVEAIRPGCLWLAESVEPSFTVENRDRGFVSYSDGEMFEAFDVCYEYDIFPHFRKYLEGKCTLKEYAQLITQQEAIYPDNYVKLRNLENHDNPRAADIIPDKKTLMNWTAFIFFQKGMTLIYAGQESGDSNKPSLFDKDTVRWDEGFDYSSFITKLSEIKKHRGFTSSRYDVQALPGDVLYARHRFGDRQLTGIFCVNGCVSSIPTGISDGTYTNMIDGSEVRITGNTLDCKGSPIIFESTREL